MAPRRRRSAAFDNSEQRFTIIIDRTGAEKDRFMINVDPDKFSYIDLVTETNDAFCSHDSVVKFRCSNGFRVEGDPELMRLFEEYRGLLNIHIFATISKPIGPKDGAPTVETTVGVEVDVPSAEPASGNGLKDAGAPSAEPAGANGLEATATGAPSAETVGANGSEAVGAPNIKTTGADGLEATATGAPSAETACADGSEAAGASNVETVGADGAEAAGTSNAELVGGDGVKAGSDEGKTSSDNDESTDDNSDDEDYELVTDIESEQEIEANNSSESERDCGSTRKIKAVDPIQRGRGVMHNESDNANEIILVEGKYFKDVKSFRSALKDYEVKGCYKLKRKKNDLKRVTARCDGLDDEGNKCAWRIHASVIVDGATFQIRRLCHSHTCRADYSGNTFNANSVWIAKKLKKILRVDPDMSYDMMQEVIKKDWSVNLPRHSLYRAKSVAIKMLEGNHHDSYRQLWRYADHLRQTNPGSVIEFEFEEEGGSSSCKVFKRVFMCIKGLATGFLMGCRPFIGLDGCHLKGPYGGILLSAVALDGNNGIYPIANAIVEIESISSWTFFMQNLRNCIGEKLNGVPYTFMSDRQKGVINGVEECFPTSSLRFCARHIFSNFKTDVRASTSLRDDFWKAVKSSNEDSFQRAMQRILDVNRRDAFEWMMREPKERWARHAFSESCKCDAVTNNISESFNNWIGGLRKKAIVPLLDGIRAKVIARMATRYAKGQEWKTRLTDNVQKQVNKVMEETKGCSSVRLGLDEFEANFKGIRFAVTLRQRRCSCGIWQLSGIPCKHAAQCISSIGGKVEDYCDNYFLSSMYLNAYKPMIHPVHDINLEPREGDLIIFPPELKRLPGRPRKNRCHSYNEPRLGQKGKSTVKCHNCGFLGHNGRSCQRAPVKSNSFRPSASADPTSQVNEQVDLSSMQLTNTKKRSRKNSASTGLVNKTDRQVDVSNSQPICRKKAKEKKNRIDVRGAQ